jgi:hypothetical protein
VSTLITVDTIYRDRGWTSAGHHHGGGLDRSGRHEVLQCAEAALVDYIVTGNKRHFPGDPYDVTDVVSAGELLGSHWRSEAVGVQARLKKAQHGKNEIGKIDNQCPGRNGGQIPRADIAHG